jgi:hypothetical protein
MELFIADRAVVFDRLKHSLELLAAPSDFQLRVAPAFGYRADELYMGFEHCRMKVLSNFESELASEQLSCLKSLQQIFLQMRHECWTDGAVADSTEWKIVRYLSAKALQAFGWVN